MFNLSTRSIRNRDGIDPSLVEISDLAIQITIIDFGHGPYAGFRTAQEQQQLYLSGKSRCDGYRRLSKHQSGDALDFYAYVNDKATWKREYLAMIAAAHLQAASILGYKIKWGGLWPSKPNSIYGWDMAHIQRI